MNVKRQEQQGFAHLAGLIAVVMTLAFICALGFGIWAFVGMQENKSDLDDKIATASAVAVQEAKSEKDVEFAELQKSPFKSYTGSQTYGSLAFDYPKTWSVYAEQKNTGTVLDFYGHPDLIPGISKSVTFAFRAQILSTAYETEAKKYTTLAKSGDVTITAFRPANVPSALGIRVVGEITRGKTGALILLPQRDKTFKIWTELNDYVADFDKVIATLNFVP